MRKLSLITGLFLFTLTAPAQSKQFKENKYRLHLPDKWKPGNKVWKKLSDKLPEVCEELKDKDLCGDDCNSRYTVEFYMSAPQIEDYGSYLISPNPTGNPPTETWEFVTYYRFQCYLLLYDNKSEELLTKVIVVDTNEVWTIRNRETIQTYAPPSPAMLRSLPINSQGGSSIALFPNYIPPPPQRVQTPFSYINKNSEKLAPQEKDLLFVVDDKFKSL
jgi:hypothetical protein